MPSDRCVECGYGKSGHDENGNCPGSAGKAGKRFATMALPSGRTCVDCLNFKRFCESIIGLKGTETSCDYFPVRFVSMPGLRALIDGTETARTEEINATG